MCKMMLLSKHIYVVRNYPASSVRRLVVNFHHIGIAINSHVVAGASNKVHLQNAGIPSNQLSWGNIQHRSMFLANILRPVPTGHNLPGQGLKKLTDEEEKLLEEKSIVLRFINRKIKEQEIGREKFPSCPDYKFFMQLSVVVMALIITIWAIFPELMSLISIQEESTQDSLIAPEKVDSFAVLLYKSLPLRFISRIFGRIADFELHPYIRESVISFFAKAIKANMEEALVKDFRYYKSLGSFFRRPLDPKSRPIDGKSALVSPADGRVLTFGTVDKGKLEQVKGITYSLQKFLGPLPFPPVHNKYGNEDNHIKNWSIAPLEQYQPALMHDPEKNNLYQCVIYLAPNDYHRFHSPCDWVMKHRRHFPGELLSVNPKVAAWVKNLFVLNERVVLSGTWKHGFFSFIAVGATNVGSIKIYEDLFLKTNQKKWKPGTYYDMEFENNGCELEKGELLGEFNMGSTVVLVFEAPKDFEFKLDDDQKLKFGEGIIEID